MDVPLHLHLHRTRTTALLSRIVISLLNDSTMIRCKWSHGRWEGWVSQASLLKSEDWYRVSVFFLFLSLLTKRHSWYCFLSVPSAEFMTYLHMTQFRSEPWHLDVTSHENKHPRTKCTYAWTLSRVSVQYPKYRTRITLRYRGRRWLKRGQEKHVMLRKFYSHEVNHQKKNSSEKRCADCVKKFGKRTILIEIAPNARKNSVMEGSIYTLGHDQSPKAFFPLFSMFVNTLAGD